jgi:hypothetical protein
VIEPQFGYDEGGARQQFVAPCSSAASVARPRHVAGTLAHWQHRCLLYGASHFQHGYIWFQRAIHSNLPPLHTAAPLLSRRRVQIN